MTNSLFRPALISAAALIALAGCWEPKSHDGLQRLDEGARGGPWTTCLDSLAVGVGGDSCAFQGGCAVVRDPESAPSSWDVAWCTADGLLLRHMNNETGVDVNLPPDVPHRLDDGCITRQSDSALANTLAFPDHSNVVGRDVLCVPDELLGPESTSQSIDLDAEGACDSLIEDREPGMACSGEAVCGLMLFSPSVSGSGANSEPLFAWCHAGRLRVAAGFVIADTCPHLGRPAVESYSCTY